MNAKDLNTIEQLVAFLEGTQAVAFEIIGKKDDRKTCQIAMRYTEYPS